MVSPLLSRFHSLTDFWICRMGCEVLGPRACQWAGLQGSRAFLALRLRRGRWTANVSSKCLPGALAGDAGCGGGREEGKGDGAFGRGGGQGELRRRGRLVLREKRTSVLGQSHCFQGHSDILLVRLALQALRVLHNDTLLSRWHNSIGDIRIRPEILCLLRGLCFTVG